MFNMTSKAVLFTLGFTAAMAMESGSAAKELTPKQLKLKEKKSIYEVTKRAVAETEPPKKWGTTRTILKNIFFGKTKAEKDLIDELTRNISTTSEELLDSEEKKSHIKASILDQKAYLTLGAASTAIFAGLLMDRLMDFGKDGGEVNGSYAGFMVALLFFGLLACRLLSLAMFGKGATWKAGSVCMYVSCLCGFTALAISPVFGQNPSVLGTVSVYGLAGLCCLFLIIALFCAINKRQGYLAQVNAVKATVHIVGVGCLATAFAMFGMNVQEAMNDGKNDSMQHGESLYLMAVTAVLAMAWLYYTMFHSANGAGAGNVRKFLGAICLAGTAGCMIGFIATIDNFKSFGELFTSNNNMEATMLAWAMIACIVGLLVIRLIPKGKCLFRKEN